MEVRLSAYDVVIFILSYAHVKLMGLMGLSASLHVVCLSLSKNNLVSCPLLHDPVSFS